MNQVCYIRTKLIIDECYIKTNCTEFYCLNNNENYIDKQPCIFYLWKSCKVAKV